MEQCLDGVLLQTCADDAQSADGRCTAVAHIRGARYIVIVDPLTVRACYNALCTQDIAVLLCILQCLQCALNLLHGVLACCLCAPALEYLVCMMMMLMIVFGRATGFIKDDDAASGQETVETEEDGWEEQEDLI